MPSTQTDRIDGLSTSVAVKAAVVCATTANITLSGLQTIDGVSVAAGDRVLVKDQTDATENGIYVASSGAWIRARDFNGPRDVVTHTLVWDGNQQGFYRVTTAGSIVIGTSSIAFAATGLTSAAFQNFSPTWTGAVTRSVAAKLMDIVHVEDFGAVASDDDADAATNVAAFENAFASGAGTILLGEGTYRVNDTLTPLIYQRVIGQGRTISAVKMIDSVTGQPLWGIESHMIELAHFQTGWVSSGQTTANSVGIRFMDTGSGINAACGWGYFHDLKIENTYTGIDTARSGTISGTFSWHYDRLYIREFEHKAMYMHNLNNGCSGDVYGVIYLGNARLGTQETDAMLDIREASNIVINLVNLEASRMNADQPICYFQNVTGFVFNGIHIEDVDMDNHTGSDNGIIEFSDKCIGVINGLRVDGVTIPATADKLALFKIKTTNTGAAYQPRITVDGVSIIDTTGIVPATSWNLVQTNANLSSANGARLSVRNIHTEKAFDGTVVNGDADFLRFYANDNGDSLIVNSLRADDQIELGDGGPLVLAGSGSPEGAVTAPVGSEYHRTNGGAGTSLYVKESGSGNTGWAAVATSGVNPLTRHGTEHTSVGSGTALEWTSLPTGVEKIEIICTNHSPASGEDLILELGDSGGYEVTGYNGRVREGTGGSNWSTSAQVTQGLGGADVADVHIYLSRGAGNKWFIDGDGTTQNGSFHEATGWKELSETLDRIRLRNSGGAAFDGGTEADYILKYQ